MAPAGAQPADEPSGEDTFVAHLRQLLSSATCGVDLGAIARLETCDRQQIVDLLYSTYEQAALLTAQLEAHQNELTRSNATLNSLYNLAGGLNRCHSETEVASFAVEGALNIPGVTAAWLFLREGNRYWMAAQAGPIDIELGDENGGEPMLRCECQRQLEAGSLIGAANVSHCSCLDSEEGERACGHVSIPLVIGGVNAGLLNIKSDTFDGTFAVDQLPMLASIGSQISDAVQRARLQEALECKVDERTRHLEAEISIRQRAERDVRTANDRLLDAIGCINDGFALFDANDSLFICNPRYQEMHAEVSHLIVPGVKFEALSRAWQNYAEEVPAASSRLHDQARLQAHRAADGKPVVLRRANSWLMVTERRTREGGIVVVETDITELKQADIAKDEFLAKISHELRTPLTPINGVLSIISSGKLGELPKGIVQLSETARRNCARLTSIVDDLLDFTLIGAGRFELEPKSIELRSFVEQVIEKRRNGPFPAKIRLDAGTMTGDLTFEGDPARIQQVLENLLSNAVKFTNPDEHITVTLDRRDGWVHVSVADNGPGIPHTFRPRVFDAFAQEDTSSTRRTGGIGLGLSLAKSIVEAHGGKIGYTTDEGKGTTFFFMLPLAEGAQPALAQRHSSQAVPLPLRS